MKRNKKAATGEESTSGGKGKTRQSINPFFTLTQPGIFCNADIMQEG